MKSSDYKQVGKLLETYRKLNPVLTCCVTLEYSFLFIKKSIPISNETVNLCLEKEREKVKEQLIQLGVEVDE